MIKVFYDVDKLNKWLDQHESQVEKISYAAAGAGHQVIPVIFVEWTG